MAKWTQKLIIKATPLAIYAYRCQVIRRNLFPQVAVVMMSQLNQLRYENTIVSTCHESAYHSGDWAA
jgi:hypothetical protein